MNKSDQQSFSKKSIGNLSLNHSSCCGLLAVTTAVAVAVTVAVDAADAVAVAVAVDTAVAVAVSFF